MNNIHLPETLICGYCDCSEFGTLKTSPERTAKSFEIEYYLENGFETYLNGEKIPIYADRILIAKPGDIRYSRLPFKTAFLKFSADGVLAEMLNSTPKYFTAVHKKQILELMHEIIVLNEKVEKDPLMSGGKLLTLISIIINDGKCEQRGQGVNRQLMHRAKKYIEAHFREGSRSGGAGKTGTYDDDVKATLVSGVDQFLMVFVVGPFLLERTGRNLRHLGRDNLRFFCFCCHIFIDNFTVYNLRFSYAQSSPMPTPR